MRQQKRLDIGRTEVDGSHAIYVSQPAPWQNLSSRLRPGLGHNNRSEGGTSLKLNRYIAGSALLSTAG